MKKESFNKRVNQIYSDIKSVKIQGAINIAKAALEAYSLSPKKETINKLSSLRPTEPMLLNVLHKLDKQPKEQILNHFSQAQDKINNYVIKLINAQDVIYTHCHSTNVVSSLINAKKKAKKFQVYNTETRPLYQGRLTAKELSDAKIKVTTFVDSAVSIALSGRQNNKKANKVFLGADAILNNGNIINKVGSGLISEIAKNNKIPVYIIADSWKFSKKNIRLEQRSSGEVWKYKVPEHIKIKNPAFEIVENKNITAIVSELGVLKPKEFVKRVRKIV